MWKVVAALDFADITAIDKRRAKQVVGHMITISEKNVRIEGEDCLPSYFEAKSVEPNLYLREQARANASLLNLPNPVAVVEMNCTIALIKNRNRLVVFWQGWFFEVIRVTAPRKATTHISDPRSSK